MNTPHKIKIKTVDARTQPARFDPMNATQNTVAPKIEIEMEWTGKDGLKYRSFRRWNTEGWSNSFLQVSKGGVWMTLY